MNSNENYGNNTFRNKVKEKFSGGVIFMQKGKYKAMLIVCGTALAMGIISFAVTVKLYDNNYENFRHIHEFLEYTYLDFHIHL